MLWDVDLRPNPQKCKVALINQDGKFDKLKPNWNNPGVIGDGLWLSRGTLWFVDDLNFLGKKYYLDD